MKKNICESKLGIEYIADVLSSCEQNGVQCIVDDANGIFYVYDNREKGNLLYIREPLSFFRIHENQDQRSLARVVDARYNWMKIFEEYTKNEDYISRCEAEKLAYDTLIPSCIGIMELFCNRLKNEEHIY